jgi:hypothetical protein
MRDFLLDIDEDIDIEADDLVIASSSDQQHREHLLLLEKGSLKQFPSAGVGLFKFLEGDDPGALLREIAVQFSADGMQVKQVGFDTNNQLIIEAPYQS